MVSIMHTTEFDKDIHHLRKYNGIEADLDDFKKVLLLGFPILKNRALDIVIIPNLGGEYHESYKARKFKCQYLKSTQLIRIIFTYNPYEDIILLVEIYCKKEKENNDVDRLKRYLIKRRP